jgi:hypothetical protein
VGGLTLTQVPLTLNNKLLGLVPRTHKQLGLQPLRPRRRVRQRHEQRVLRGGLCPDFLRAKQFLR